MTITQTRTPLPDAASLRRPAAVRLAWLAGRRWSCSALLCVASVAFGVREVSVGEIVAGLGGDVERRLAGGSRRAHPAHRPRDPRRRRARRWPGTTMQAVTRNPLADPGILGRLGRRGPRGRDRHRVLRARRSLRHHGASPSPAPRPRRSSSTRSARSAAAARLRSSSPSPGAATSAAFTSLVSAVLLPRVDVMETFRFWQIGGVGGATWDRIAMVLPVLAVGAVDLPR